MASKNSSEGSGRSGGRGKGNQQTKQRRKRGRAVKSILRDMANARDVIAQGEEAKSLLPQLQAELDSVPAERREREMRSAEATLNLLNSQEETVVEQS